MSERLRSGQPLDETRTRRLLVDQLRAFHARDWVSGTGGGICGPAADGNLLVAPTGVHKELVEPEDLFVLAVEDSSVITPPADVTLRPSECAHIFTLVARERGVRSIVHTHALGAVLAADLAVDTDHVVVERLEMLKGIRGLTNQDRHLVPVIDNTPREAQLVASVARVLADPRFASAFGVLVRDHGCYIWGTDIWEAKRHTEVYHYLFGAVTARHERGIRPSAHPDDQPATKEGTRP
ncbi:MAG: methylthioribulose 1-phosphate dehydratase [Chloroflexi bacterium]|nr:methylthioribulose 1-phosphate dehydratase [Chloroflexota bacterium]